MPFFFFFQEQRFGKVQTITKHVTLCKEGPAVLQLQIYLFLFFCQITLTPFAVVTGKSLGCMWRARMSKAKTHEKMMCGTCGPVSGANKHRQSGAERGLGWESSWTPTSGVLLLHFAALTRGI